MSEDLTFSHTQKGKKKACYLGYCYNFDKLSKADNNLTFWQCEDYHKVKCKARIHIKNGKVCKSENTHNHAQSKFKKQVLDLRHRIKEAAKSSNDTTSALLIKAIDEFPSDVVSQLKSTSNLRRTIQKTRQLQVPDRPSLVMPPSQFSLNYGLGDGRLEATPNTPSVNEDEGKVTVSQTISGSSLVVYQSQSYEKSDSDDQMTENALQNPLRNDAELSVQTNFVRQAPKRSLPKVRKLLKVSNSSSLHRPSLIMPQSQFNLVHHYDDESLETRDKPQAPDKDVDMLTLHHSMSRFNSIDVEESDQKINLGVSQSPRLPVPTSDLDLFNGLDDVHHYLSKSEELTFSYTQKGKRKACYRGYLYNFDKASKSDDTLSFWQCEEYYRANIKCRARIHIKNEKVCKSEQTHNHPPNKLKEQVLDFRHKIKEAAKSSNDTTTQLLTKAIGEYSTDVVSQLPSGSSLRRLVQKTRQLQGPSRPSLVLPQSQISIRYTSENERLGSMSNSLSVEKDRVKVTKSHTLPESSLINYQSGPCEKLPDSGDQIMENALQHPLYNERDVDMSTLNDSMFQFDSFTTEKSIQNNHLGALQSISLPVSADDPHSFKSFDDLHQDLLKVEVKLASEKAKRLAGERYDKLYEKFYAFKQSLLEQINQ